MMTIQGIEVGIKILTNLYPDLDIWDFKKVSILMQKEFNADCTEEDLERFFYELDDDNEREGRKIEYGYNYNKHRYSKTE